jgi:hypothetical protein
MPQKINNEEHCMERLCCPSPTLKANAGRHSVSAAVRQKQPMYETVRFCVRICWSGPRFYAQKWTANSMTYISFNKTLNHEKWTSLLGDCFAWH